MRRCDYCGGIIDDTNYACMRCGKELSNKKAGSGRDDIDMSLFRETNTPVMMTRGIDDPSLWMYILSVFNPILQWIFMGVYVSKNDFDSAFGLWIKTLVAQVVIAIIFIAIVFN